MTGSDGLGPATSPRLSAIFADDWDSHGNFSMAVLQSVEGGISWNVLKDTFFYQLVDHWLSY